MNWSYKGIMRMDAGERATTRRKRAPILIGRVLSGVAVLFLLVDAGGKLLAPQSMIDTTPAELQLPHDVTLYRLLGAILAVCVALHLWRRTALLGAVLVTGFLGGAVAVNVRAGMPLATNTLFSVYMGVVMWVGFYLRDARLRVALS
jgi:hypothetical protein